MEGKIDKSRTQANEEDKSSQTELQIRKKPVVGPQCRREIFLLHTPVSSCRPKLLTVSTRSPSHIGLGSISDASLDSPAPELASQLPKQPSFAVGRLRLTRTDKMYIGTGGRVHVVELTRIILGLSVLLS